MIEKDTHIDFYPQHVCTCTYLHNTNTYKIYVRKNKMHSSRVCNCFCGCPEMDQQVNYSVLKYCILRSTMAPLSFQIQHCIDCLHKYWIVPHNMNIKVPCTYDS